MYRKTDKEIQAKISELFAEREANLKDSNRKAPTKPYDYCRNWSLTCVICGLRRIVDGGLSADAVAASMDAYGVGGSRRAVVLTWALSWALDPSGLTDLVLLSDSTVNQLF
jgi:hypothetical protein